MWYDSITKMVHAWILQILEELLSNTDAIANSVVENCRDRLIDYHYFYLIQMIIYSETTNN